VTEYRIPELSLVVLVGVSGSGKSTFARQHFGRFEVISSDFCRGLVADDENDQAATRDAFDVLGYIAGKRLGAGRLTVIDATNVQADARKPLIDVARAYDVLPVAIVLDIPQKTCIERNASRADRSFGSQVIHRQHGQLRRSLRSLSREGFRVVHVLRGEAEVTGASIVRHRMLTDYTDRTGPFDVIGDVHGCRAELEALLGRLGYQITRDAAGRPSGAVPPAGRTAVFLGDLVDRGPDSPGVLRLVMGMVAAGQALAVPGNHENKLIRALSGKNVQVSHGLAETLSQLAGEDDQFRRQVTEFCHGLVSHLMLDGGRLVVAHAGLKEAYHGRASGRVRSFALYGDTTGETDEYGLPVRLPWAADYRGRAMVLYGHTPVPEPEWVNNTLCLDTGCVFGGRLTALRYPERELVSVPAGRVWYEPVKPLASAAPAVAERDPGVLFISDVLGKRVIETSVAGRVTVREENAAGALEVMSRFALDPRWLLYLPPTMAPCATAAEPGLLEHPAEAFAAYAAAEIAEVICEEKHMGSRAIVLACRDDPPAGDAASRFGAAGDQPGAVYTRTGRPFFAPAQTRELLDVVRAAVAAAGLWEELDTSWLLLDCELMPWSVKAEQLLRQQYAAVGAAGQAALPAAAAVLAQAQARGLDVAGLAGRTAARLDGLAAFRAAYRRYCWPVAGLDGLRLAPFQLLATERDTYYQRAHSWHLALADRLAGAAPGLIQRTRSLLVDTGNPHSVAAGIDWWSELTGAGGEGMVVKPAANCVSPGGRPPGPPGRRSAASVSGPDGAAQPGIKVRGPDYLRIIYGPDYALPDNLARLQDRSLGRKRSLALREYALGLEALDRVVSRAPLWRVHEAVFGVLALESEPVDPRL
jgi:protein phosphatase